MGISTVGAATTAPINSARPKFTYNTSYSHSYTTGSSQWGDMVYVPTDNSIIFARNGDAGTDGTFVRFTITNSTFSAQATLPTAADPAHQFAVGHDGTIAYCHITNDANSRNWAISTDNGSSFTNQTAQINITSLFPISQNLKSLTNSSDSIPIGIFYGSTGLVYNRTAGATYTLTASTEYGYLGNSSGTNNYRGIYPIRKGDDDFVIGGYYVLLGAGRTATSAGGTRQVGNIYTDNKRSTHFLAQIPYMPQEYGDSNNSSTYQTVQYYLPQRKPTCIEGRWFLFPSSAGFELYDYINQCNIAPGLEEAGRGVYCSKPVYISATKKLYLHNSNTQRLHVWDVTFE